MATAKKRYRPGKIIARPPVLVNSFVLYRPFEEALKRVIETGQAEVDEHGITIYRDVSGKPMSYWHTLQQYIRILEMWSGKTGRPFDTKPLKDLLDQLKDLKVLDEETAEITLDALIKAQQIFATIPQSELLKMTAVVRMEFRERKPI